MNRNLLRIAAAAISMSTLSGCAFLADFDLFDPKYWALPRNSSNNYAEIGLAELAKGNNVEALGYFERALQSNEFDVHALYGLGVLYQNTGQPERARKMYQAILSIEPRPAEELMVWADKRTQPIVDLANVNMHLLDSNADASAGSYDPMASSVPSFASRPQAQPQTPVTTMYGGGTMMPSKPTVSSRQAMQTMAPPAMFKEGDLNIVERFETLRALLDQGLVTQDEFLLRRKVNVGALLPLTSPPPGAGLDRPVPAAGQIADRLNAIGRALEMRALSPAQHTAERTMILDALMPSNPVTKASPALPPKGLMEAADAVRRLEMLKEADLITSDEYTQERRAIEGGIQPGGASAGLSGAMSAGEPQSMEPQAAAPKISGFQPAVHLASYRQQKAAERGWAELSRRFNSLLGGMEHRIERVDLGGGKGVFYRLKVGPLPSNGAAQDTCRKLKAQRQYCEPTTINFG